MATHVFAAQLHSCVSTFLFFSATCAPVPQRNHERDSHGRHRTTQATPRQPDLANSGVSPGPEPRHWPTNAEVLAKIRPRDPRTIPSHITLSESVLTTTDWRPTLHFAPPGAAASFLMGAYRSLMPTPQHPSA